ncbi:MAG: glutamine ABC transporter substrate-binding protein [Marinosulfonomonas sp.]|nr:MAG: glutamine ABC transporter substrate-binding protein [Marinosulfonomonas sp.]
MRQIIIAIVYLLGITSDLMAQDLTVVTVTRPPFSMDDGGIDTGFSIELWTLLADELKRDYKIVRVNEFSEMLDLVTTGKADLAVANISITAGREALMDFSQPIFESGLQIMTPNDGSGNITIFRAVFSRDMLIAMALAIALLFGAGMLMWRLERNAQPYFERPAKEAVFPAFWWALNLVVNGGFEERVPRTVFGRFFAVILVISSLFIVSIFVAKVTATLTIDALQSNISSPNDLFGKKIGTIFGSTASVYMDDRDIGYLHSPDLENLLKRFEDGELDAVVFDAPILAFYVNNSNGAAKLASPVFQRENYGIALPSGSELAEPINQSLLRLREDGTYNSIFRKWFGRNPD